MIDFGSIVVASSSPASSVEIANQGASPTGVISPIITGADATEFKVADGCDTLFPMGTCTVTVTFSPTSVGVKTATLLVSASPGGSIMLALTGTATN